MLWPVAMVLVLLVVTLVLLRVWWARRERAQEGHLLHRRPLHRAKPPLVSSYMWCKRDDSCCCWEVVVRGCSC